MHFQEITCLTWSVLEKKASLCETIAEGEKVCGGCDKFYLLDPTPARLGEG